MSYTFGLRDRPSSTRTGSWRLREQLGSEEREVRAVKVHKCRPRSMRHPVRILCPQALLSRTGQTA